MPFPSNKLMITSASNGYLFLASRVKVPLLMSLKLFMLTSKVSLITISEALIESGMPISRLVFSNGIIK